MENEKDNTESSEVLLQRIQKNSSEIEKLSNKQEAIWINGSSATYDYNPAADEGLWLSGIIMGFSLILVAFMTYLIKTGSGQESVLKVFGTILIIVAAVFLIVAGYSEKQIAPVIGLLGTIVGYILGKEQPPTITKLSPNKFIQPTPKDGTVDG